MDTVEFSIEPTNVVEAIARFQSRGPHPEYSVLETRLGIGNRRRNTTFWRYIEDSVEGGGGYTDGRYMYSYRLERDGSGRATAKLFERVEQADYDNFPRDIIMAPWDTIVQSKDMIVRKSSDPRVEEWWDNVDGSGTSIMSFNESVQRQSQMYGNGFVLVDRQNKDLSNAVADMDPDNLPYCTQVPSEFLVDWSFGDDGELFSVTILEPTTDETWKTFTGYAYSGPHNLRIWTQTEWALFKGEQVSADTAKIKGETEYKVTYKLMDMGQNLLGEVPIVSLNYSDPGPKKMLCQSPGIEIARIAQTVYNMDSEYREIERKCSVFLAMPVKDSKAFDDKKAVVGRENLLVYDGDAGKPEWITPDLTSLDKYAAHRQRLIESAYAMAHLRSLVHSGATGAKSGFQSEVEFGKTERRISSFAVQMEIYETKLTRLFLKYMGVDPDKKSEDQESALIDIQYPREYGIHDVEKAINRSNVLLAMNLGETSNRLALTELFKVLYPRLPNSQIDAMVEDAVVQLAQAAELARQAALGGAAGQPGGAPGNLPPGGVPTPPGSPKSNPRAPGNSSGPVAKTASQRIQELITRDVARDSTRDIRNVT